MQFCLTGVFHNIDIMFVEDETFEKLNERWRKVKKQEVILKEYLLNYAERFFWVENPVGTYNKHIFETTNCVFVGYWQTEKYFKNIRNELLSDFSFDRGDIKFEKLRKELSNSKKYVSVHIRRGDYLKYPDHFGNLVETKYYKTAIKYMNAKVDNPVYVYFSDDIQWVRERFGDKSGIFIDESMFDDYHVWYDMCLMSCCAHNIIANSSYSWWGAWLNRNIDKIVLAPEIWFIDSERKDIWCDNWVKISIK